MDGEDEVRLKTMREYRNLEPIDMEFNAKENDKINNMDYTDLISVAECFIVCYNKLAVLKNNNKRIEVYAILFSEINKKINSLVIQHKRAKFERKYIEDELNEILVFYWDEIINFIRVCNGSE